MRYLKQKKLARGNQVLFYFSKYLKKYTLYKKPPAPFFKLYQAIFTITKQGYTMISTSKTVYIKVLILKLVKKREIFSQYSLNIFNCTLEYPNVPCKILELSQLKGEGRGNRSLKNISNNQTHQIFALFATVFILKRYKKQLICLSVPLLSNFLGVD